MKLAPELGANTKNLNSTSEKGPSSCFLSHFLASEWQAVWGVNIQRNSQWLTNVWLVMHIKVWSQFSWFCSSHILLVDSFQRRLTSIHLAIKSSPDISGHSFYSLHRLKRTKVHSPAFCKSEFECWHGSNFDTLLLPIIWTSKRVWASE